MKRFFTFAMISIISITAAAAQNSAPASDDDIIPAFENSENIGIGEDRNERMTVNVDIPHNDSRIMGKGPFKFIIDTAAQRTVLSRELANDLQLELERELKVTTLSGTSLTRTVYVPQLLFGKVETTSIIAPTFGRSSLGADGILGLDSLQGRSILFDFEAEQISLTAKIDEFSDNKSREIIVRARRRNGQLIFTDAIIAGVKVNVIIDTGSESSIGNLALQRRLRLKNNQLIATSLIDVVGNNIPAQFGLAQDLRIGRALFPNLPIAFADIATFKVLKLNNRPALFLGMDALRKFDRFAIDFEGRRIYFLLPETAQSVIDPNRI